MTWWRRARPARRPDDATLLRQSGLFDPAWYAARHPHLARLGGDPLARFLRVGLGLGHAPGPGFDPGAYLAARPDVAAAGLPALRHHLHNAPAAPVPLGRGPEKDPLLAETAHWRALLETGGLDRAPLIALARIARRADHPDAAAQAAETLALWALLRDRPELALGWLARRAALGPAPHLDAVALVAAIRAGDRAAAEALLARPDPGPDLVLAATWAEADPAARLARLNALWPGPARLAEGTGPALDRIAAEAAPVTDPDAPLVSVIMAAHDAAGTIGTAMRAVTGQSWRALELLVVDDASTDATAARVADAARRDPRITLIALDTNAGAYAARNAALARARGAYVTLHDADDWSHPARLETQIRHLARHPGDAGCMTRQMRCTPDLRVSRWTGTGAMLHENLSSLMLPTALVRQTLGGWDEVRAGADSELLRRVRHLYGAGSVPVLPTGPLTLQRDTDGSATADGATGMGWFYYGARRAYFEAQRLHHATAATLYYPPGAPRPFAAPAILRSKAGRAVRDFDRVYAGCLYHPPVAEALLARLDGTGRVGIVALASADLPAPDGLAVPPAILARIDGARVARLVFGETARTGAFALLPGPPPAPQRYLPRVFSGDTLVLGPADPAPWPDAAHPEPRPGP